MVEQKISWLCDRRNHQDNLIHTRLGWLIATQAFLLVAFVTAINAKELSQELRLLIPVVGLASTSLIYVTLCSGIRSYMMVRAKLHQIIKDAKLSGEDYSDILLGREPTSIQYLGLSAPLFVPLVCLGFWSALLVLTWSLAGWVSVGVLAAFLVISLCCAKVYDPRLEGNGLRQALPRHRKAYRAFVCCIGGFLRVSGPGLEEPTQENRGAKHSTYNNANSQLG